MTTALLVFHILAGAIAIASGMVALFAQKGSRWHRKSGNVFFVSMLCMAASGAMISYVRSIMISLLVGVLTCYLVATAWMTVKRPAMRIGRLESLAALIALAVGTVGIYFGWEASNSPDGLKDGFPAGAYYFFGGMAMLAFALDIRMFVRGGVAGTQRLARHLWRMGFALYIATASFFLGQADLFSERVRELQLLWIPVLIVVVTVLFWLARVLLGSRGALAAGGWGLGARARSADDRM